MSKLAANRHTRPRAKIQGKQVKKENTSEECDAYLCNFCNIAAVSMHVCPSAFSVHLFCKACLHRHQSFGPCTLSKASTPRQGDTLVNQINTTYHLIPRDRYGLIIRQEKCQKHEIVAPFYCRCCNKHRCIKCVNDKCLQCFGGSSWSYFINRDKQSLLEHYEKASAKFNIIEKHNHMLRAEFDQLQTTTLLRRERIRQEFVSFHDLLIEKEHDMLKQLAQDERERMDTLNNLQANLTTLELDDANLATMVTDLVQTCYDFSSSYEISSINLSKFVVEFESLKNE